MGSGVGFGAGRKFANVLVVGGMLTTNGCACTYDPTDHEKGGDMVQEIGSRDYAMTVLLLPMLIGGILAASAARQSR